LCFIFILISTTNGPMVGKNRGGDITKGSWIVVMVAPLAAVSQIHVWMDLACKYVVSAATAFIAVTQTPSDGGSLLVPYVVGMSVVSAMIGKSLKRILRHKRPSAARKDDHGMPSSHGLALAYLSWAAMLACLRVNGWSLRNEPTGDVAWATLLPGVFSLVLGVYWSILRVTLGDHSAPQVVVGYVIGGTLCVVVYGINFVGYEGVERGGRVDALTTQDERWAITRIAAGVCSTVFLMMWKMWRTKDVTVVVREAARRNR
jgi:hypothetical protein